MGLNLSNEQIGQELDLDPDEAQAMTTKLREGIVERKPVEVLSGEVECDGCDRASAIDYAAFLGFFSAEPS